MNKRLHKTRLGLCEFLTITRIDCNVAKSCGTVVLDIDIRRRQQLYEDWYCASIYKLLSIVICDIISIRLKRLLKAMEAT